MMKKIKRFGLVNGEIYMALTSDIDICDEIITLNKIIDLHNIAPGTVVVKVPYGNPNTSFALSNVVSETDLEVEV